MNPDMPKRGVGWVYLLALDQDDAQALRDRVYAQGDQHRFVIDEASAVAAMAVLSASSAAIVVVSTKFWWRADVSDFHGLLSAAGKMRRLVLDDVYDLPPTLTATDVDTWLSA